MSKASANPLTVGQVVGARLRALRAELGLTQEETIKKIREAGLPWTVDILGRIEAGHREDLTLSEVVLLTVAFARPTVAAWFPGQAPVRLSESAMMDQETLRSWLGGPKTRDQARRAVQGEEERAERAFADAQPTEVELHAAKRLGIPILTLTLLAVKLWERRLGAERDRRLEERRAEIGAMTPDQRQAYRGHITRELLAELRRELDRTKRSQLAKRRIKPAPRTGGVPPKEETA